MTLPPSLAVARRELRSAFNAPLAWVFLIGFQLALAFLFLVVGAFFAADRADLRPLFDLVPFLLVLLVPALTMRQWAEERRQGTWDLLATLPISDASLVIGKYLASMAILALALALSLPLPLMVGILGTLDAGQVLASYCGLLALASAASALGQFVSAKAANQVAAFIATLLILAALNALSQALVWFDPPEAAAAAIAWLSPQHRLVSFGRGMLDTRDLAYFALATAFFLFATVRSLRSLRGVRG